MWRGHTAGWHFVWDLVNFFFFQLRDLINGNNHSQTLILLLILNKNNCGLV